MWSHFQGEWWGNFQLLSTITIASAKSSSKKVQVPTISWVKSCSMKSWPQSLLQAVKPSIATKATTNNLRFFILFNRLICLIIYTEKGITDKAEDLPSVTPKLIYRPYYYGQLFDFECFYRGGVTVASKATSMSLRKSFIALYVTLPIFTLSFY